MVVTPECRFVAPRADEKSAPVPAMPGVSETFEEKPARKNRGTVALRIFLGARRSVRDERPIDRPSSRESKSPVPAKRAPSQSVAPSRHFDPPKMPAQPRDFLLSGERMWRLPVSASVGRAGEKNWAHFYSGCSAFPFGRLRGAAGLLRGGRFGSKSSTLAACSARRKSSIPCTLRITRGLFR